MEFKVGNKVHELTFGVGFIRNVDKATEFERDGVTFGAGISVLYPLLEIYDVGTLATIIRCALPRSVAQPTVDRALDEYGEEHGDFDELFDEVKDELKNSPATKRQITKIMEEIETGR